MKSIGLPARIVLLVAGLLMLWGVPGEIGASSEGSRTGGYESSFLALQLRAIGGLKLGMGLGLVGVSLLGVSAKELGERGILPPMLKADYKPPTKPKPKPVMPPIYGD